MEEFKMSIIDTINKKKAEFRERQNKRMVSKGVELYNERVRLEKEVRNQEIIDREKAEISKLRSQKGGFLSNLGNKVNSNLDRRAKGRISVKSNPIQLGTNMYNGNGQGNIFTQSSNSNINPFQLGSGSNPYNFSSSKKVKERKPKNIIIRLR